MRIHTDNAESFIQALALSISKDPASLEIWRFVHIEHSKGSTLQSREKILSQLKETHTDMDCDIVQCMDNDILFVTRSLHHEQLHALANEFINAASMEEGCVVGYALYDLFRDWQYVRDLLLAKSGNAMLLTTKPSPHYFNEIAMLEEPFAQAKKFRKERFPLHVMLVEDDPITCRLVTGAFKETYAMITASNAHEAVTNYLLYAPDIVFLDIGLPDASGFDVLHQIMASDNDAYVVMFSSNSYLDNVTTALSNGACGFVAKPFKKEKMRQYIQDSALHHHKQHT